MPGIRQRTGRSSACGEHFPARKIRPIDPASWSRHRPIPHSTLRRNAKRHRARGLRCMRRHQDLGEPHRGHRLAPQYRYPHASGPATMTSFQGRDYEPSRSVLRTRFLDGPLSGLRPQQGSCRQLGDPGRPTPSEAARGSSLIPGTKGGFHGRCGQLQIELFECSFHDASELVAVLPHCLSVDAVE